MVQAARLTVEFDSKGVSGVKNDIGGVGSALDSANGKGQSFFSTMMGTAGGFLLAGGLTQMKDQILGIGSSIITANSNMEMWTMQLAVSTGSMDNANAVIKDMQNMAKISPFDLPELIQGANALESLGFSSQKWMTVIGDTAAGTNKSVDQVVQAMMDASTGEFERLKELGIRTSAQGDKIQFQFMRNGQMMVVEADNTAEGIEQALFGIWDDKYGGAMETMSDTWVGRLGNFKDTINMALMDFGKPLFDTMKEAVLGATMLLETFMGRMEAGQGIFHSLLWSIPETLRNLGMGELATAITPAIKGIENAWNGVARVGRVVGRVVRTTLGKAFEILGDNMDIVAAVGKSLITVFGVMFTWGAIGAIISGIGAVLGLLLSPIGLIIAAVAALYLAWDRNWFGIRDIAASVWNAIEPIFNWIVDAINEVVGVFEVADAMGLDKWAAAWEAIKIKAGEAFDIISDFLSNVDWGGVWDTFSSAAGGAWDAIRSGASSAWEWLSGLDWGGLVLATWEVLSSAGTWITEKLGSAVDAISTWFSDQFSGVDYRALASSATSYIASAIGDAVSSMASITITFANWLQEQIEGVSWDDVGHSIGTFLGTALKAAIGLLVLGWQLTGKLMDELGDVDWDSLGSALWDLLKTAALAALNLLIGIGKGIYKSISDEIAGIGWEDIWDPILSPIQELIDDAVSTWDGWMTSITSSTAFTTVSGWLDSIGEKLDVIAGLWNSVFGDGDDGNTTPAPETSTDPLTGVSRTPRTNAGPYGTQSTQWDRDTSPAFAGMREMFKIGQIFNDAAGGALGLNDALTQLNPNLGASNDSFGKLAMVGVPMYTSSTRDADNATGAMAGNMGTSFAAIASNAASRFADARNSAVTNTSDMQGTTTRNISTMAASVGGSILGMQLSSAVQMALMASTAKTQGDKTGTNMLAWTLGAQLNLAAAMLGFVSTIRNTGGSMYDGGEYVGRMAGLGVAAGLNSTLALVRGAANNIVATVNSAMISAGRIMSPSRLTMYVGEMLGMGPVVGLLSKIPEVKSAAGKLIDAAIPEVPSSTWGMGGLSGYAYGASAHQGGTNTRQSAPQPTTIVNQFLLTPEAIAQLEDGALKGAKVYELMTDINAGTRYGR